MARCSLVLAVLLFLIAYPSFAVSGERGLLWRVVQACIAAHDLTGASFPCLEVQTQGGVQDGYAVLRAPFEETHIIVTPTVRTIGIEAPRLREPGAPNYFRDAWLSRHFVTEGLSPAPGRADIGLAVNSKVGRSQDQLHIHVDCLRPDVRRSLARHRAAVKPDHWTSLAVLPRAPLYWATLIRSEDLGGINLFAMVAESLHIAPLEMSDLTIVVAGMDDIQGQPGFMVLARQRNPLRGDIAHGEVLLDHACREFR